MSVCVCLSSCVRACAPLREYESAWVKEREGVQVLEPCVREGECVHACVLACVRAFVRSFVRA